MISWIWWHRLLKGICRTVDGAEKPDWPESHPWRNWDQFESWRRRREKERPFRNHYGKRPYRFTRYSVYEIFKVLWLSYTDLKYRIQPGSVGELAFVELDLSAPLSTAICIVEMQNQDGARMRMYFKGNVGHLASAGISVNDTRILFEKWGLLVTTLVQSNCKLHMQIFNILQVIELEVTCLNRK